MFVALFIFKKCISLCLILFQLTTTTYAVESATYLTSLLMDQYEKQDCDVETAIVKVAFKLPTLKTK